jgi:hypothetical protein
MEWTLEEMREIDAKLERMADSMIEAGMRDDQ